MIFRFGQFELDGGARELRKAGVRVEIEPKALDILLYLAAHPDRAVSKDELQSELWPRTIVTETALTRSVMKARRAVDDDASSQSVIRTIHGHGYRFVGNVADIARPAESATTEPEEIPPPARSTTSRPRWRIALAAAVVFGGLVFTITNFDELTTTGPQGRISIAVLPIADETGDASLDWVRLGLMSLVGRMLVDEGVPIVPDQAVISAIGDSPIPRPLDRDFLDRISRIADARQVLDISLQFKNGLYRMSAVLSSLDGDRIRRVIVGESPAAVAADMARVVGSLVVDDDELPDRRLRRVSSDPFVNEAYARALDLELQGRLSEARTLFRLAAEQEPRLFWLRYEIALCARDLGEDDEALRLFDALLRESRAAGDGAAEIATLNSLGVMHLNHSDFDMAADVFGAALQVTADGVRADDRAKVHVNLALIATNRDDRATAASHYEQAVAAFDEVEMTPGPSFLNNYAGFLMGEGRYAEARDYSERAVAGFRLRGHRRFEAIALNRLAKILRNLGEIDAALERHEQALAIHRELDNPVGETIVMMAITNIYRDKGDLTRARLNALDVRERSDGLGNASLLADANMYLAQVEEDLGDYRAAREQYVAARNAFAAMGTPPGLRYADHGIARMTLLLGDPGQASKLASELLEQARAKQDPVAEDRALQLIAQANHATGRADQAVQEFLAILDRARDRHDEAVIRDVSIDLAEIYLDMELVGEATRLLDESGLGTADEPDAVRIRARLAYANGDPAKAVSLMSTLRSRIGEAWRASDDELLNSFSASVANQTL